MTNRVRIVTSVQLTVLYCFAVVFYNSDIGILGSSFAGDRFSDYEQYFVSSSPNLLTSAIRSEYITTEFEKLPISVQKNNLNKFTTCDRIAELHINSTFSKYIIYSIIEVERFQQTDIIFPFQYFW